MNLIVLAGMTFVSVVALVLTIWWAFASEQAFRSRLVPQSGISIRTDSGILRSEATPKLEVLTRIIRGLPGGQQLERLTEQAGWAGKTGEVVAAMILLAGAGALLIFVRLHNVLWSVVVAILAGALPVAYLHIRRNKRMDKFSEQFPEALDMMLRALRSGYATGAAIQLVAEEMPDPVGPEFKMVFDEISLGRPLTEALVGMCNRIDTEDVRFFYTAMTIQRDVGGNLAEIFEKLSHVIRERYRILSYARVLSSQQRGTAYVVGLGPLAIGLLATVLAPRWLDPLWQWQYGKYAILAALVWQIIGFLIIRRIADIKV